MSNALVPFDQLNTMAAAFAKSGMFGAKTAEQALSLLLLAQAEGVHPAIAMRDFDIIQGRPAKKAEAMQRSFLAAGGKIEWLALSDTKAEATFSHPQGGKATISWDHARAEKAGLAGKDMYRKYPRQMLKARVVSEGCRTVYPAATSGLYVPEEVRDFAPAPREKHMGTATVVADEDGVIASHQVSAPQEPSPPATAPSLPSGAAPAEAEFISIDQATHLGDLLKECDAKAEADFLKVAKLERLDRLPAADYDEALDWVARRKSNKKKPA
jgi:hypothetical protein